MSGLAISVSEHPVAVAGDALIVVRAVAVETAVVAGQAARATAPHRGAIMAGRTLQDAQAIVPEVAARTL